ncbi:MAG: family 78 glycoside hydrolase catalytic domain [Clostridia bacterium]|nr:family 78 glycoside hydrolase catalytic domain [Clostridia bacterium]
MNKNAKWITAPRDMGVAATTFRRELTCNKEIKKATLCASAMGNYALFLNGERVGKGVLAPGWTSYKTRVLYQTYDLTSLLRAENRLEISVGQGWAVGYIGHVNTNHCFAERTAVVAWLHIRYADGTEEELVTDEAWDVYTNEVTFTEIYHGETVDKTAPIECIGKAMLDPTVKSKLVPQDGEWITEHERLAPIEIFRTPKGELVLDFGQNMTGYVEVRAKGKRGDRIVIHHAEVLDAEGNFYTGNFRHARNENTYILSGGEDVFKPTYTFQGFRYIQLVEYPFDTVDPDCFRAVVVHSDIKRTGEFRCGNEKINQLYHNIIWGQKSNYLDIPTDCPQRDERLGWTGDAQIFCRTAAINFDVEKFFRKWMRDLAIEQGPDGSIRGTVPDSMPDHPTRISAAWGDVACVVPWELYMAYGNKAMLREQFPTMVRWVEYMHATGEEEFLWLTGQHYGDWLAMDAGEDSYVGATSCDFIASAFFAYSTELLVRAGEVLGKDMTKYREMYQKIRARILEYFFEEDGTPKEKLPLTEVRPAYRLHKPPIDQVRSCMTQTTLVLMLHFRLCPEKDRERYGNMLVQMIRENGNLMSTGFVGTPYLLHALTATGHADVAYELLMEERAPSWLYSVNHGATTMWEHWNSLKEDGTFWSTDMNSFNHYAYGTVYDWIFGAALGIKPTSPAYREIEIAPHPNKCLGWAEGSVESRSGKIRSHWYYKGDVVYYEFDIPEGVTARVTLPGGFTTCLGGGSYRFAE